MNSQNHNWSEVQTVTDLEQPGRLRRWWDNAAAWRYPVLLVLLPTLLVAGYYYIVAADQYESEAHFIVNSNASGGQGAGGFGSLFGISAGGSSQGQTMAVPDYLESHDAVAALSQNLNLVAMFRRPEADMLSRLSEPAPSPEELKRYFDKMVKVHYDTDTGINTLIVHAFRPADAHAIADQLMRLSEDQVNRMNRRRYRDAVAAAQNQVATAETRVAKVQSRITAYRQAGRDIDPQVSGEAQIRLVSALKAQLATAQATLATMSASISRSSPQYLAMQRQVRSLQSTIGTQSSELTGGAGAVASNLGGFENLRVQQAFAAKNYEAAAASLVKAQQDAASQQLYVVRVVDANMPVQALFPQRARIVLMTLLALSVAYGIGWLILAGVREHAA